MFRVLQGERRTGRAGAPDLRSRRPELATAPGVWVTAKGGKAVRTAMAFSPFCRSSWMRRESASVDREEAELIKAVRAGDTAAFEPLVRKHQARIFGIARRYARRESEVEDIVQEVFLKAYRKLHTYHGEAPFEHWLSRIAVRTCYDYLRAHQRNREYCFAELSEREEDWLNRATADPGSAREDEEAAKALVQKLLNMLPPQARMVVTLLDIERRSVKEISELTGWSPSLVKVRAFRARAAMRRLLKRISCDKYL